MLFVLAARSMSQVAARPDEKMLEDRLQQPKILPLRLDIPERRYLTIMFSDLIDYTRLSETLEPEDLREIVLEYQRTALAIIERYGGFVGRFVGDGILACFGYPVAHEADSERAVRAGLELVGSLDGLNAKLRERSLPGIGIRIGIHTGLVVVGPEMASGGIHQHGIVGEAANVAARLQANAPANSLIVSGDTFGLVSGLFDYESLGQTRFKGLSRPVELYRIRGTRVAATRIEGRVARGGRRFVGRIDVLHQLIQYSDEANATGRAALIRVTGDAGIGKTRFALEFARHPRIDRANILQFSCHELFSSTPLYAFAQHLWVQAHLTSEDSNQSKHQKIAEILNSVGMMSPEDLEIAYSLLGHSLSPPASALAPTPYLVKRKQFDFLLTLIDRELQVTPALVIFDDVHWMDPSSGELVFALISRIAKYPVLVLILGRSFPSGPPLPTPTTEIRLLNLEHSACLELARSMRGSELLSDREIDKIILASEGIPLFLEYLVTSSVDQKRNAPESGKASGLFPLSLAEMMSARLDVIQDARSVVQAAACIGRAFTAELLSAVLRSEEVAEPLKALVDAEILHSSKQDAHQLEFRHSLLQQAAYNSVVQPHRHELHARIAAELQSERAGERARPELIAHHLTEANAFREAASQWLEAGREAARRSAHVEAIKHLRRGLDVLHEIPASELRDQLELGLQAALIGSLSATDGPSSPTFNACCERGLALCRSSGQSALILPFVFGQFTYSMCRGELKSARSAAELFLHLATTAAHMPATVIGHRLLGMVQFGQGSALDAQKHLTTSLEMYRADRDEATTHMFGQNTQVHSRSLLSLVLFCLGSLEESIQTGLQALKSADDLLHPHSTALAQGYVGGWVFGLAGAKQGLTQYAQELIALSERHQLGPFRLLGTAFMGWALCQDGRLIAGTDLLGEAVDALESIEFRLSLPAHLGNLAYFLLLSGKVEQAKARCAQAFDLIQKGADRWFEPELHRIDALIWKELRPGDLHGLEWKCRRSIDCARSLHFAPFEYFALKTSKDLLGASSDIEERLASLSELGAQYEKARELIGDLSQK